MNKKEYEQAQELIKSNIEYIKQYKSQKEIEQLAGLLQLADDDPLAKATITSNKGFCCDLSSTADAIEAYEELNDVGRGYCGMAGGFGNMIYYKDTCDFFDEHKIDINSRDQNGATALMIASYKGNKKIIDTLIDKGADIHAKDYVTHWNALLMATQYGHLEIAQKLIDKGIDANAHSKNKETPLLIASRAGYKDIAQMLIENGTDVNAKDIYGATALMESVKKEHLDLAKLLIDKGADVNMQMENGKTALLIGIEKGIPANSIRALIECGAEVNIKDNNGFTALDYARKEIEKIKEKVKPNNQKYLKQLQEKKKAKAKEADLGMGGM